MNREIKFRMWDAGVNRMVPWENVQRNSMPFLFGYTSFPVMQYTGLKDKNGVEIYEGDIVIAKNAGQTATCEVKWSTPTARFFLLGARNSVVWNLSGNSESSVDALTEVIGNIYENPEFLKEE